MKAKKTNFKLLEYNTKQANYINVLVTLTPVKHMQIYLEAGNLQHKTVVT